MIDLSLAILRAAMERTDHDRMDTPDVRLALRCLLPHCAEHWPLADFWRSARRRHDIGRAQGCDAAFEGILLQLRRSGSKLG